MKHLTVALATYNEEANLARCLKSVAGWVDEIVVVDGGSTDKTVEIARSFGATIIETTNPPIFHINKQKALDEAEGTWVLQLDADEAVSPALKEEILAVTRAKPETLKKRAIPASKLRLFARHQALVEARDGIIGTREGEVVAFFVARRNYFLGHPMTYGGMYPDGVIRLVKRGKAHFPAKSVHEQIAVDGRVSWLVNDLLHYSNPTFARYMIGANKYTTLVSREITQKKSFAPVLALEYLVIKPIQTFISLLVFHKGILDGVYGVLFAFFSSLHFPVAYMKHLRRVMLS